MTQRTERIDELLRQEIGSIIAREIADPRVGFATVTSVVTTPDLRHAKVFVSVIGQAEVRKATLTALGRAMPFIQHELGKRLRIKRIPQFHLELDDTLERGTRVLHLLDELEAGHLPEDPAPDGESLPTPVPRLPHEGDAIEPPEAKDSSARDAAAADVTPRPAGRRRAFRPPKNRTVPGRRRR
jgi:ribosome-binding factor A